MNATMEFKPLAKSDRDRLAKALRNNGDNSVMMMDRDTSFAGTIEEMPTDAEVISAVKSVPCHY